MSSGLITPQTLLLSVFGFPGNVRLRHGNKGKQVHLKLASTLKDLEYGMLRKGGPLMDDEHAHQELLMVIEHVWQDIDVIVTI